MLTEGEIFRAIGAAIDVPDFDLTSTSENTENWDSLGILSIVSTLSKLTNGRTDKIPEIVTIESASQLAEILRLHGLLE